MASRLPARLAQLDPRVLPGEPFDGAPPNPRLRTLSAAGLALALMVVLAGGVLGYVSAGQLAHYDDQVVRAHEAIEAAGALLSTVQDAETGQRGYLLTEKEHYLEPYRDAVGQVQARFVRLKSLAAGGPGEQAALAALDKHVLEKLLELQQTVDLVQQQEREVALEIVLKNVGKVLMDQIRSDIEAVQMAERELLDANEFEADRSYQTTLLAILVPAVVAIVLLGSVFFLLQRGIALRERGAALLAEQGERLRTTLASIGDAVISTDAHGVITYLNAVAESLTGWKTAEAAGQPLAQVFRIVNEGTRQPVPSPALRALEEGVIVGLANHTILIARDGTERPIDDSAAPIRCRKGEIVGCVLVFRDVSERRRDEQRLHNQSERYAALVTAAAQVVWSTDPQGEVVDDSPSWRDFTGQSAEQRRGRGWLEAVHPDDRARADAAWSEAVRTHGMCDVEYRLRRHDGGYRWTAMRGVPVLGPDGSLREWVGMNTDIEERRRAEIERKLLEDNLRKLAADLSETDRRKDEFLATLAHELRNPLAPIRNGLAVLSLSGDSADAVAQTRGMMERQFAQLVRLVDDLLDVSRISQGKLELRRERVSLATVIASAVETSRPSIEAGGHQLDLRVASEPVFVDADETRLAQVFANLLNNAAKYSERGSRIELVAVREGPHVVVRVRDSGVGIPAEMLSRVFDLFTQVERSLERSQGGLGIGLTLVKRLVEMHGGSVEARSAGAGRGSEFIVRLPASPPPAAPRAAPDAVRPAANVRPRRILVADDNADSATSLSMLLQIAGHIVHVANDGEQAVAFAAEFRPDVVLLDIGMPRLNGYEACRRILGQPGNQQVVLIALTGWGQDDDRRRSLAAGFHHHLVKPVDLLTLARLLA